MSIPISQFIPTRPFPHPLSPLGVHTLFSTSVSLFLPWKLVHLYRFSRFHVYALIYDICFSLSDWLHSVWQSLGPSTSLQVTQFHFFLWLSNIPLYILVQSIWHKSFLSSLILICEIIIVMPLVFLIHFMWELPGILIGSTTITFCEQKWMNASKCMYSIF